MLRQPCWQYFCLSKLIFIRIFLFSKRFQIHKHLCMLSYLPWFCNRSHHKHWKPLHLTGNMSQPFPIWSICQGASKGRAPWGWLLVISLSLTDFSPDRRETNVFYSASTFPQPCQHCSLVKHCFPENMTRIASAMSVVKTSLKELAGFGSALLQTVLCRLCRVFEEWQKEANESKFMLRM